MTRKKLTAIILALAAVFSLCACGGETESAEPMPSAAETTAPTPDETANPVPTETPAPTPTPRAVRLSPLPVEDAALSGVWYLLAVNPAAFPASQERSVNGAGAEALIRYFLSEGSRSAALACTEAETALYSVPADAVTWTQDIAPAAVDTRRIHFAVSGACLDSGLLRELISGFERDYGYTVELYSADDAACADTAAEGWADVLLLRSLNECDRVSVLLGIPICTGTLFSKMLVSRDVLLVPTEELGRFAECKTLADALGVIKSAGLACDDLRSDPEAAGALEQINANGGCALCTESAYLAFAAE